MRFHIIHTNDLHSHFGRWPQTVATIKRLQEKIARDNEAHLLVDIGDHMDRADYITEGSYGQANVELMNQVGYDYATIGNNEGITFSKAELNALYREASFTILLNNLFEEDGSRPSWLLPYTIHKIGEVKIGLIGSTIDFIPFYNILGWKMTNALDSIRENVLLLREQVDFLIVLSHLGLPQDKELAEQVEGIDLIIGAHTHHLLYKGLKIKETWLAQAGKFGEFVGQITVEWDQHTSPKVFAQCFSAAEEKPDPETELLLTGWREKAERELAQPVVFLDEEMPATWFEESPAGNLLAEGLNLWCQGSIALVNSGVLLDHLVSGLVTKRDLHRICPHPINPCLIKMKGMDIWSILERSLSEEVQHKEIKGFGFRGKVVGMLSIDGLEVNIERRASRKVIKNILVNGNPLQSNQEYSVATLDMFTFQALFPELYQPKQVQFFLPEFIRDILQYRLKLGDLKRAQAKRWKFNG